MAVNMPSMKLGPKAKIAAGIVALYGFQAAWGAAVDGKVMAPPEFLSLWWDHLAHVMRWLNTQWQARNGGGA